MQIDIVTKLNDLFFQKMLDQEDLSEAETLYVLAQIRKLSEHLSNEEFKKYQTLFFYCDWALHTKLDRSPVKAVLEKLSENRIPGHGSGGGDGDFLGFITFRNELKSFLDDFDISVDLVTNQDSWFELRNNLIQIIMEVPLERKDTKIVKFSLLKESSDGGIQSDDYHYWFQIVFDSGEIDEWNIMLADYGPKRRSHVRERVDSFFQRYADKIKYKKLLSERNKKSDTLTSKDKKDD